MIRMKDRQLRLPSEIEYIQAIERITNNFDTIGTVEGVKRYHDALPTSAHQVFNTLANFVNPRDRTTGEANLQSSEVRRVMRLGSAAGLLIASFAYEPEPMTFGDVFGGNLRIGVDDTGDAAHDSHAAAATAIDVSAEGIRLSGDAVEEWLIDLEMQTVQDVQVQRMYRVGAGLVLYCAHQNFTERIDLIKQQELQEFADSIEGAHDFDWDAAFGRMEN